MQRALRNIGRPGAGLMAIAALEHALWDLKGRLTNVRAGRLLGRAEGRAGVWQRRLHFVHPGTNCAAVGRLVEQGISRVKMKVGAHPAEDPARVRRHAKRSGRRPA